MRNSYVTYQKENQMNCTEKLFEELKLDPSK